MSPLAIRHPEKIHPTCEPLLRRNPLKNFTEIFSLAVGNPDTLSSAPETVSRFKFHRFSKLL